jgi:hypothetical protein
MSKVAEYLDKVTQDDIEDAKHAEQKQEQQEVDKMFHKIVHDETDKKKEDERISLVSAQLTALYKTIGCYFYDLENSTQDDEEDMDEEDLDERTGAIWKHLTEYFQQKNIGDKICLLDDLNLKQVLEMREVIIMIVLLCPEFRNDAIEDVELMTYFLNDLVNKEKKNVDNLILNQI